MDHSFFQRDGLGHMDNRPKSVGKEGQPSLVEKWALMRLKDVSVKQASSDGPSFFQRDGLGRLDNIPKVAGGEGQPNLATVWASLSHKSPWDEPIIKARASNHLLQAEEWFAEEKLVRGMGPSAARGTPERCSIADECFLEEASRYSLFKPSIVCVWGVGPLLLLLLSLGWGALCLRWKRDVATRSF